ncbi:MAG: hypothetical protein Q9174_004655 [Haloplaca sp. 1 TL-2023]
MTLRSLVIDSSPIYEDKDALIQHPPIGTGRPRPGPLGQAIFHVSSDESSSSRTPSPQAQNAVCPDLPAMQAPLPRLPRSTPPLNPIAAAFRPAASQQPSNTQIEGPPRTLRPLPPLSQHPGGMAAVPPPRTQRERDLEEARQYYRGRSRASLEQEWNIQQRRISTLNGVQKSDETRRNGLLQQVIEERKLEEKELKRRRS